ncbi:hypothetical protein D4764_17G0006440 [Takifugu flavidus]|uniref:Uncharacterized protein n=1 Tax=Takifugu flavidus TaxID=433684 RepID=A0A5C6NX29_9TELE|nr:hypothetical protein D4764_17G0006440 [Takifugu flavidus]
MQLLCQQYTLNATQDTRRSIKDLEMEIVELEAIGSSTGDRGCIETLQSKKMALASLLDSQVQGALVRSRIQDLTEMDAPSSFFFGWGEKKHGQNLIIHSLLSSTGQELVEPGQIRQRAVEFFSSLYEKCVEASGRAVPSLECSTLSPSNPFSLGLSCMEPPSGLLAQLQTRVLAFFWDSMHWVQQGVLYLPREEGGQGLIHLASRTAAFRIQFVQRFLTGPADLMWRDVARCVFRRGTHGARSQAGCLGRSPAEADGCTVADPDLLLQHVVAVAGPDLTGAEAVGSLLGIRSTQAAEGVLRLWRNRLSTRERRILEDYGQGTEPDSEDPFPEIRLVAHLGNLDGPLLRPAKTFSLVAVDKKTLYNDCVRVLNRRGLSNKSTSVWADRLGGDGAAPAGGSFTSRP